MAARQTQQDQVDGVYAALGRPPAVDAEDYVDAVYMVLAAAARTHQRQRATLRKLGNSKKD